MVKTNESGAAVAGWTNEALDVLHGALAMVKLAAYAADAMRVLDVLQRHADHNPSFDQSMRSVCIDWRNPGSLNHPADLISEALLHASSAMGRLIREDLHPRPIEVHA